LFVPTKNNENPITPFVMKNELLKNCIKFLHFSCILFPPVTACYLLCNVVNIPIFLGKHTTDSRCQKRKDCSSWAFATKRCKCTASKPCMFRTHTRAWFFEHTTYTINRNTQPT